MALMAAAGTAGCYSIIENDEDDISTRWISVRLEIPTRTAMLDLSPMRTILASTTTTTHCEESSMFETAAAREAKLKRKKTILNVAASLQRLNTTQQVSRLRTMKDDMLNRWQQDEEGWRDLPSRAWPEYQPNPQQLDSIVAEIERLGCTEKILSEKESGDAELNDNGNNNRLLIRRKTSCSFSQCMKLLFDMASGMVFYQVNPGAGFALYESLAKRGHTDAMVACGIVLVEGLGIPPREHEGFAWLEKAIEAHDNNSNSANKATASSMAQACYELGCVYYTGIDGIVEEDPEKAFGLFERAAEQDHTAALYMVADCLVEGEGTERNVSTAVPLFYKAAERGHRYSRQRIRELLEHGNYPL